MIKLFVLPFQNWKSLSFYYCNSTGGVRRQSLSEFLFSLYLGQSNKRDVWESCMGFFLVSYFLLMYTKNIYRYSSVPLELQDTSREKKLPISCVQHLCFIVIQSLIICGSQNVMKNIDWLRHTRPLRDKWVGNLCSEMEMEVWWHMQGHIWSSWKSWEIGNCNSWQTLCSTQNLHLENTFQDWWQLKESTMYTKG